MLQFDRFWLAIVTALLAVAPLYAQQSSELPPVQVPAHPPDPRELDHVEALKLYALGAIAERHNRLIEAVRSYEEAARLDPDAAAPLRALAPIYLALDRTDDALEACRKALELDPEDYETGFLYGRQLRAANKVKEAVAVLRRTTALPGLKERPDLRLQICLELGALCETADDLKGAEHAFSDATAVFDQPDALVEQGPYTREEIDGQAAETFERLGRLCLRAGRTDQAAAAFQQAQKKDPARAAPLSYNLAEVYASQGKSGEALERLDEYLLTQPQGVEGYELKITLQRKLGRDDAVVSDLEASSGRDKQNVTLQLLLGREYHRAGRNADAERVYLEAAKDSPSPEVYQGLFDLYKAQAIGAARILDALDRAVGEAAANGDKPADPLAASRVRDMLQVVRGEPELVKDLLIQANQRLRFPRSLAFQTRLLLAALAARTHQLSTAENLYRSCLDGVGGVNRGNEQEVYFGLLRILMLGHKYEEVVTVATRGLKNEATLLAPLYEDLSMAQMALGRTTEALVAADEVVRKAEDEAGRLRYRLFRAEMLSQAGKHSEAATECLSLLKEYNTAGDVREIRMVLSMVYSTAHDRAKSEEQLELVLKADPEDAAANNDLGYQWADGNKNVDEAERMIRKALDLDHKQRTTGDSLVLDGDQDNASYVDSLGWILFRKGKLAEARAELERAVSLPDGSDSPEVWDHLGDVYFRSEMTEKAGEAWRKAVSLYETTRRRPDDRLPEIQEKLRLLKP